MSTLHPAFDVLQKHGIRPVTNSPDGTFTSNCKACGKLNSNFVHYDDDEVGWHCHDCGDSRIVPLRPAQAKPSGNVTPPGDGADLRAFEEARAEFPEEHEPEPAPEPDPECEPEPVGDGSFSHIWRSKDHDYPCTPTGEEQCGSDGRIYVRVRIPDGGQNFVPKDELFRKDDLDPQPEPEPEPQYRPSDVDWVTVENFGLIDADWLIVKTFDYLDRDGVLSYVVDRIEFRKPNGSFVLTESGKREKTFLQKRPDPVHPGHWFHNTKGCPALPYRLPELIEAVGAGHEIYVVEGEGKVNLLWSWNVPATCNAGGSGGWTKEHAEYLRGADVVIVGDNDIAGRKHVQKVGVSLKDVAKRVRVLDLPGLSEEEDVIDWAKRGGTVEQLYKLTQREAKPFEDVPPPDLRFYFAEDLERQPVVPLEWDVEDFIPSGGVTGMFGDGGTGKDLLLFQLAAVRACGGGYWLGKKVKAGRVIYCNVEDNDDELNRRRAAIAEHYELRFANFPKQLMLLPMAGKDTLLAAFDFKSGKVAPTELYANLRDCIASFKPALVIVGNRVNIFGVNQNDDAQAR
jgi:hypothetical protein